MKQLNQYITEELKHPLWCEVSLGIFKNGNKNMTQEGIANMVKSFLDVEGRLKKFSDYLAEEYPKEYLAYQPNDDDFCNKDNNDKICGQIAEFIYKFIIN